MIDYSKWSKEEMIWELENLKKEASQSRLAYKKSEKRFQTLFNQVTDYLLVLDPFTKPSPVIVDLNEAAWKMHASVMKTTTGNYQTNAQVLDITDFIVSKNELAEKTFRLEKAQQIGRVGFLDWDLETNKIILSDLVYEMYGLPPKTFNTPEFVSSVVYPPDLEMVSKNLEFAIQNKKSYNVEHRIRRPDGSLIWVHAMAELVVDEESGKRGLLGTIRDITMQKEARQKIRLYSKQLEKKVKERTRDMEVINRKLKESNRELDSFAYSVSHDLKAPLRAINGFARELQHLVWDRLNEEEKEYLDIVLESSVKMVHLVDDLLKLSRSGRKKPTMRKVAVRPLVKDVLEKLQDTYKGRDINVSIEIGRASCRERV